MEEFGKLEERVVLVGVQTDDHDNVEESLDELKELASTAGAVTVGRIIQNRESVHPGTYIGKGKIEEVRALVYAMDATGIICDDELSPAQLNNLERELDCKVMDRTLLILDIFAARAITSEGKIQVELAQLRYRSARLVGLRESLSRLGGGIGTRGPGEKKLETDRRLIRTRISGGAPFPLSGSRKNPADPRIWAAYLRGIHRGRDCCEGKGAERNLRQSCIKKYFEK